MDSSSDKTPSKKRKPTRSGQETKDLIDHIRTAADKLESDGSSRGDLKLLSRALRELCYALKVFSPYRRQPKVTLFGSARTEPNDPAYLQAVHFGRAMAEHGWWMITGSGGGIMEAGHLGAGRENSMGLNILLPFEQSANAIIDGDDKLVHMRYFFTRKLMFVKECDAVVCLPGGFGTLDEALEVLTLLQTGKRDPVPLILLDSPQGQFWKKFDELVHDQLLGNGMICEEDRSLYMRTSSYEEAVEEILTFYRVYHSMRYVKKQLVMRLREAPNDGRLGEINSRFADILSEGEFQVTGPLPEERDESDLEDLPRLTFHFNRRNLGRLRQLVDFINGR